MGNKIGKRRQVVDEQYTRPQGLYQHRDVDHKKLRKLILDAKLAPCYPGDEECALDLEECPICFLYYPSLNRSRCCMKGICTECFLQMKPHNSTRPIQCPFCKTSTYAVEYRGVRTKEEKGVEQLEEQRVIEAHIRMRRRELQDEEEGMQKRQEITSSIRMESSVEAKYQDMPSNSLSVPSSRHSIQGDDLFSSEALCSMLASRTSHPRPNREDNFDLDLEEIMVMEAIWHSIQEQGTLRNPAGGGSALSAGPSSSEDRYDPSGGLACAVATLAEHQHMNGPSTSVAGTSRPILKTLQSAGEAKASKSCPPGSWTEMAPGSRRAVNGGEGEWSTEYGSEVGPSGLPLQEGDNLSAGHHILPESFEEQMMLAMAVSLAEARARTTTQGLSWMFDVKREKKRKT